MKHTKNRDTHTDLGVTRSEKCVLLVVYWPIDYDLLRKDSHYLFHTFSNYI